MHPESTRDPELLIWTEEPLNAEAPLHRLADEHLTPTRLFFIRNHGAIPKVDPAAYGLTVLGLVSEPLTLSLEELGSRFERVSVTAYLSCAGNRRRELAAIAPIPGELPWGPGATGNAEWRGFRLRDVLQAARLETGVGHVAFEGLDRCHVAGDVIPFGASIPLDRAIAPDVLLADEMNGEPLAPAHGYPLRVVVPGFVGARSVKWVSQIAVQGEPSSNYFQARSYRLQPGQVLSGAALQDGFPLGEMPLNSVICQPSEGQLVTGPTVLIRGYAITGGPREIEWVEISQDGGATFVTAELLDVGQSGTWRLWEAELEVSPGPCEVVVRARDSAANAQPDGAAGIWNPKGYVTNSWHKIRFEVADA